MHKKQNQSRASGAASQIKDGNNAALASHDVIHIDLQMTQADSDLPKNPIAKDHLDDTKENWLHRRQQSKQQPQLSDLQETTPHFNVQDNGFSASVKGKGRDRLLLKGGADLAEKPAAVTMKGGIGQRKTKKDGAQVVGVVRPEQSKNLGVYRSTRFSPQKRFKAEQKAPAMRDYIFAPENLVVDEASQKRVGLPEMNRIQSFGFGNQILQQQPGQQLNPEAARTTEQYQDTLALNGQNYSFHPQHADQPQIGQAQSGQKVAFLEHSSPSDGRLLETPKQDRVGVRVRYDDLYPSCMDQEPVSLDDKDSNQAMIATAMRLYSSPHVERLYNSPWEQSPDPLACNNFVTSHTPQNNVAPFFFSSAQNYRQQAETPQQAVAAIQPFISNLDMDVIRDGMLAPNAGYSAPGGASFLTPKTKQINVGPLFDDEDDDNAEKSPDQQHPGSNSNDQNSSKQSNPLGISRTPNTNLNRQSRLRGQPSLEQINTSQNHCRTQSKNSYRAYIRQLDDVSDCTINETIVSKIARFLIDFVNENPGVHLEKIIAETDAYCAAELLHAEKSKMRRTYDVMNILQMAEVFIRHDKKYWYNPVILEGKHEAARSKRDAEIAKIETEIVQCKERLLKKQRSVQGEVDHLLRYGRLVRRNKAVAESAGEKPKQILRGQYLVVKTYPNPQDSLIKSMKFRGIHRIGMSSREKVQIFDAFGVVQHLDLSSLEEHDDEDTLQGETDLVCLIGKLKELFARFDFKELIVTQSPAVNRLQNPDRQGNMMSEDYSDRTNSPVKRSGKKE